MKHDKEKQIDERVRLTKKFPNLLGDLDIMLSFSVGNGWIPIVESLCEAIKEHIERENFNPKVSQIKEKFGGLRFYMSGLDDKVSAMINLAERISFKICEDCGCIGKHRTDGWMRTLCDDCEERYQDRFNH